MKHKLILIICSLYLSGLLPAQEVETKYRVWVDGVYDLAHYGHQHSFKKARTAAALRFGVSENQIYLVRNIKAQI